MYEIELFETEDGKSPVGEFIGALDGKMWAKVDRVVKLLHENGPALREPHSSPLGDGIFELRAKQGSDITRVLYFFYVGKRIVFTNGFIKKTQKTPKKEIEKAKNYRKIYFERKAKK
ncbi:MAG: type II toxin-antitoxin system RelE/ParE family toxin [Oscillospiraceae bacterium]|jgi:phage-related protein|nr:type II toxin-antitoxin system RelE/ParE family toxin [Oscillospiraceae bacterium]